MSLLCSSRQTPDMSTPGTITGKPRAPQQRGRFRYDCRSLFCCCCRGPRPGQEIKLFWGWLFPQASAEAPGVINGPLLKRSLCPRCREFVLPVCVSGFFLNVRPNVIFLTQKSPPWVLPGSGSSAQSWPLQCLLSTGWKILILHSWHKAGWNFRANPLKISCRPRGLARGGQFSRTSAQTRKPILYIEIFRGVCFVH